MVKTAAIREPYNNSNVTVQNGNLLREAKFRLTRTWLKYDDIRIRMCMCIVENFVVEYETFLSSSTDRKEEGGIVRIGRQIFGRRRNRVLDLF